MISRAKDNLADRYLSKVEQLFNDYMHVWLGSDAVRGILDIDFNVSIEENQLSLRLSGSMENWTLNRTAPSERISLPAD